MAGIRGARTRRIRALVTRLLLMGLLLVGGGIAAEAAAPTVEEQTEGVAVVLTDLEDSIRVTTERWIAPLQDLARRLLFGLLGLALVWRYAESTLRNADFPDIVLELVRTIMYGGFFLAVIQYSPDWARAVVRSFAEAAALASGGASEWATPAGVFQQGLAFVGGMLKGASVVQWPAVALIGAVIVMLFAVMAAYMLLVIAEMYIVTSAGVLLLGFGGAPWTDDFAKRYLIYTVSVGGKLFALLLVVGFSQGIFETWAGASAPGESVGIFPALGVVFMAVMLTTMLPNMVQGIINGSSIGSGGPALTGMMAGVSSAVAGGVMRAAKMGVGVGAAAKGTAAAMGASSLAEAVQQGGGGVGGAAKFAGKTTLTVGKAMLGAGAARLATGGVVGTLKGMQAAAEATRDGLDPTEGALQTLTKGLAAGKGPGGTINAGGGE